MKKDGILQQIAQNYFQGIADDISNAKVISSVFPNMSDLGDVRENVLLKFLQSHLPSRCSVVKGGFVFDAKNNASRQIDLLVVNDFSLRFSYFDQHSANNKNIQTIEGCLAAISVKSTLDKDSLYEALHNLASIPKMPADFINKINPMLSHKEEYLKFPRKILFAFSGLSVKTIVEHINSFYDEHKLEAYQKADCIIVNNSFCIQRIHEGGAKTRDGNEIQAGVYHPMYLDDKQKKFGGLPLFWLLMEIQKTTKFCSHIVFDYLEYLNAMDFNEK